MYQFIQSLPEKLRQYHTPAASLAFYDAHHPLQAMTLTQDGQTLPTETLFQAGSISKEIFALAVLSLRDEGLLDLDQEVNFYLKQVPGYLLTDSNGQPARRTLRQLLSHTGGLTVHGFEGYPLGAVLPTIDQILTGTSPANSDPVIAEDEPDQHFRYSGGGTTILQKIVSIVTGSDVADVMEERVLRPLGMHRSTYRQPLPPAQRERAVMGYPFEGKMLPTGFHVYPELGAAGLWTTASDLIQYGQHLQQIRQGQPGLIRSKTLMEMTTPAVSEQFKMWNSTAQVGLGCFIKGNQDQRIFGHSGWNEGYVALMNFYLDQPQGFAVLFNSNEASPLLYEIQLSIAEELGWQL